MASNPAPYIEHILYVQNLIHDQHQYVLTSFVVAEKALQQTAPTIYRSPPRAPNQNYPYYHHTKQPLLPVW